MSKKTKKTGTQQKANRSLSPTDGENPPSTAKSKPRCLQVAKRGIQTGGEFAKMMAALMSDVIEGKIPPQVANATVNAGGKLLKVVEMQLKYGVQDPGKPERLLRLLPLAS